jgi:hypothetical protein
MSDDEAASIESQDGIMDTDGLLDILNLQYYPGHQIKAT